MRSDWAHSAFIWFLFLCFFTTIIPIINNNNFFVIWFRIGRHSAAAFFNIRFARGKLHIGQRMWFLNITYLMILRLSNDWRGNRLADTALFTMWIEYETESASNGLPGLYSSSSNLFSLSRCRFHYVLLLLIYNLLKNVNFKVKWIRRCFRCITENVSSTLFCNFVLLKIKRKLLIWILRFCFVLFMFPKIFKCFIFSFFSLRLFQFLSFW